jgi:hypothetical protein
VFQLPGTRHQTSASWAFDCSLTLFFEVVDKPHPTIPSVAHGDDSRLTCLMAWRGIKQRCSCEQNFIRHRRGAQRIDGPDQDGSIRLIIE